MRRSPYWFLHSSWQAENFFITTFVIPNVPGIVVLNTPTMNVFFTPTAILESNSTITSLNTLQVNGTVTTETIPDSQETATVTPEGGQALNGCVAGKLDLTAPPDGGNVSGVTQLSGVIQVTNFGFYKYEYSTAGSNTWVTIAAGNEVKSDGSLGNWDVSLLNPGDYQLRLVVYDNQGIALTPCVISVKILTPTNSP